MALLSRDGLLAKQELKVVKVDLDKGDFVYVKEMTARARDRFDKSLMKEIKDKHGKVTDYDRSIEDFRAKLAVCTICDEEGTLLLKPADYGTLSENMGAGRMEVIVNESQELNKISDEDKENLVKNSEGDQVANSTSDSAEN